MNTALWLLLNYEMCLEFWLIFCGGLHKLYSSSLMKENALWQSQTTQVIKESAKIYLESQIPGTLYSLCKTLACVFPHIFLCIFLQLLSRVPDSLWHHESQQARHPGPSPTPRVYSNPCPIKSVMPSSHLIPCLPLPLLPPIPPSIRVFSNESALCMRWPKYWNFIFSISPSIEHPGLISLRMDWLDLLAVQGILKSLLQHHSSKASIFQRSAFFTVQLSHSCMTTGKTIALTRWTFVGKVMSLCFNMLSRLVITFLARSKRLLISWLQLPSAVVLEPKKIKSATVSTVSPSICHEVMGPDAVNWQSKN